MQAREGRFRVGVVGASGYSGMELVKILARHPGVGLEWAASDRWAGRSLGDELGISGAAASLRFVTTAQALAAADELDAALLATPADVSLAIAPRLLEKSVRVVDLSGAFRLADTSLYPAFYGFEHTVADLKSPAIYGIPELFRDSIRGAHFVASGGCYATAAALAVGPLARAKLVADRPIVVDALSGTTGAGRTEKEEMSFSEVGENARAYRVLAHQHTPEIEQTLGRLAGVEVAVLFTPHLVPMRRGILATAYVPLRASVDAEQVYAEYTHDYAYASFIKMRESPNDVSVARVAGTNTCEIGVAVDARTHTAVVVAALDNLRKGAASQAVQNLNLALGLEETTGLSRRATEGNG
ncbi:MAG: N-acetyl-gamma-glutamyl-phosphate reductase [Polyangiaceae bacterium]